MKAHKRPKDTEKKHMELKSSYFKEEIKTDGICHCREVEEKDVNGIIHNYCGGQIT